MINKIRNLYRSTALVFFNAVLLLVCLEIALGMCKFLYKTALKKQLTKDMVNHSLIRPKLSSKGNYRIIEENNETNYAVYQPWVQFKWPDYEGEFVNASDMVRNSMPAVSKKESSNKGYYSIFFLGGSTMYGVNVADTETIPAQFVNAYEQLYPNGDPIKVFNYGTPYYFSYQELMLLIDQIQRGNTPNAVVFLDGLNDFIQLKSSYLRQPFFTPQLKTLFDNKHMRDYRWALMRFIEQTNIYYVMKSFALTSEPDNYYDAPEKLSSSELSMALFNNYIENIKSAMKILDLYGIKYYFFCQPVPFYKYNNRKLDTVVDKKDFPIYDIVYPLIEKKSKKMKGLYFLGNLLEHEKGLPFIDNFHYSPDFNRVIAQEMLRIMKIK